MLTVADLDLAILEIYLLERYMYLVDEMNRYLKLEETPS